MDMKKYFIVTIFVSFSLYAAHDIPDRFLGQSVTAVWGNIHASIASFFEKEDKPNLHVAPKPGTEVNISPFQKLFRHSISFTNNTANILSDLASHIIDEAKEKLYTVDQAADRFIERIEDAGSALMKTMLNQTLDVDLDLLMPSLQKIRAYIRKLQKTVPLLEDAAIRPQIDDLLAYLETTQKNALDIQKAGMMKLSAKLASNVMFGKEHKLVHTFKQLYGVYPTAIEKINDLKINDAGKIAHRAFNNASELVEQMVLLHDSTGKIGHILIDDALVHPLDSLKNKIRKLGNAIEFVTSTEPVVVVAPPTTTDALLEILKTFVWRGGFSLKEVTIKKVEHLVALIKPIEKQIKSLVKKLKNFRQILSEFQPRLHKQFVAKLKESPLTNIPLAPKVLLDVLEQEIEIVKTKLVVILHASLILIYHVSDGIAFCSSLLECVNQFMGATAEEPFIHRDIIRGVGFVAQDAVSFRTTIINVTEALKEFNPIPFRDEEMV
jgi:hypothetical protein